jgi:preprotein translocase subunit SecE
MPLIDKPKQFFRDVKLEMSKVSWPSRQELRGSTIVVIAISLMFAAYVFVADRVLQELVKLLLTAR